MKLIIVVFLLSCVSQLRAAGLSDILPFKSWEWVERPASVLPAGCDFVYGGGRNRLFYVGRVLDGKNIFPAAIHHYGRSGTESVHFIGRNGTVEIDTHAEWLCSKGLGVGWARVNDLSKLTVLSRKALPVGFNAKTFEILYACIVHSFFSDKYPASIGIVRDGHCVFEVNGGVVSSADFTWWHTLELLVIL